jgi:transcriptional regulator with XRE-family HTH domain
MPVPETLGAYLRERRTRLDPAALGYGGRRRTLGLRREEVAQRAGISTTWYSWLEQGRGGAASESVLDRLVGALMLTEAEREHVFLLGLGRSPAVSYQPPAGITPRLQRVLDTLDGSPALLRTATWDVVAWNRAAAVVLNDYGSMPPTERNLLRLIFLDPEARARSPDWEDAARFVVGVFRGDAARAGAVATAQPLIEELCARSPDFNRMWSNSEVSTSCQGTRRFRHAELGDLTFEFSSFAVDGRPDLAMLVYTPLSSANAKRIKAAI